MKLERLRGRKICERVLRRGSVWKGKVMQIRYMHGTPPHPHAKPPDHPAVYAGTFAPSKLDKSAVRRNRMRRRCREALRIFLKRHDTLPTLQLLIAPRSSSLSCAYEEIEADIRHFFSSIPHGQKIHHS